jgi:hypothetical protein
MSNLQTQKPALSTIPPLAPRYIAVYDCPARGEATVVIAQMRENRTFRVVAEGRARDMRKAFDRAIESALSRVPVWDREAVRQQIMQDLASTCN